MTVVPGYPDRILPKDDAAAEVLKKRTLTNLYNQRPAWLDNIPRASFQAEPSPGRSLLPPQRHE